MFSISVVWLFMFRTIGRVLVQSKKSNKQRYWHPFGSVQSNDTLSVKGRATEAIVTERSKPNVISAKDAISGTWLWVCVTTKVCIC